MTNLELYHFPGSLCSQKVKLVLAEKDLEWKSHLINLLTFENLQPGYVRMNPKAVVPTLVHDGKIICDSLAIIRYIDEAFPDRKLTPNNSKLLSEMNRWIDLQDKFPMRELMYGNMKGIDGIVSRRSVRTKKDLIPKLMREHPELYTQYLAKLKDVEQWNATIEASAQVAKINERLNPILDQLEHRLTYGEWLCESTYSLADSVWTAVLNRLEELKFDVLWSNGQREAIASYIERLKARPSFKIAIQNDVTPVRQIILPGLRRIFLGF